MVHNTTTGAGALCCSCSCGGSDSNSELVASFLAGAQVGNTSSAMQTGGSYLPVTTQPTPFGSSSPSSSPSVSLSRPPPYAPGSNSSPLSSSHRSSSSHGASGRGSGYRGSSSRGTSGYGSGSGNRGSSGLGSGLGSSLSALGAGSSSGRSSFRCASGLGSGSGGSVGLSALGLGSTSISHGSGHRHGPKKGAAAKAPTSGGNGKQHRIHLSKPHQRSGSNLWTIKVKLNGFPNNTNMWQARSDVYLKVAGRQVTMRPHTEGNGRMWLSLGFTSDPTPWLDIPKMVGLIASYID